MRLKTTKLTTALKNSALTRRLFSLTLRGSSNMRYRLRQVKEKRIDERRIDRHWAILAYDDNKLLGWAMLYPLVAGKKKWGAYFYVGRKYRRLGIGSKLYDRTQKLLSRFDTTPWDNSSEAFFGKMAVNG